jgi:lipid-binding SYLF domain-containing protein
MKTHLTERLRYIVGIAVIALLLVTVPAWSASKEQKQESTKKRTADTLSKLYKLQPSARKIVEKSAGYAVFSNFGMKLGIAGGGSGKGMAVDNKSKQITYMKMVEVQAGLGLGVKNFELVWVFDKQESFNKFVNSGWELGGQTSATAKSGTTGGGVAGAISVSPGVWLYQIVGNGLALELTVKGTKYYKDKNLN